MLLRNKKLVLRKKWAFFLRFDLTLYLLDSIKSITHDSDKQVEKRYLQENRACKEEHPVDIRGVAVVVSIKA